MAEQRSTIVQPAAAPNKSKGARRDANLRAAFPESPIYKNDITDEERRKAYQELALDGVVNSGNGINSFDRDFKGTTLVALTLLICPNMQVSYLARNLLMNLVAEWEV